MSDDAVREARRLRLQHDDCFYGPMKGARCNCDACVWAKAFIDAEAELAAAHRENATLREALERIERLSWPSPQWTTRSTILSVARAALAASPAAEEPQP